MKVHRGVASGQRGKSRRRQRHRRRRRDGWNWNYAGVYVYGKGRRYWSVHGALHFVERGVYGSSHVSNSPVYGRERCGRNAIDGSSCVWKQAWSRGGRTLLDGARVTCGS